MMVKVSNTPDADNRLFYDLQTTANIIEYLNVKK